MTATTTSDLTVQNVSIWPYGQSVNYPITYYYHDAAPPTQCSGDVHVFPCPHCEKCKCGAATVKRGK